MRKVYLYLLLFSNQILHAQQGKHDSLLHLLSISKADTQRLNLLNQLSAATYNIDIPKALSYAEQGIQLAQTSGDKQWLPLLYESAGRMHANLMHLDTATAFYQRAREGFTAINNKKGLATISLKFAWVHKRKGEFEKALAEDLQGLRIMEELEDQPGIAGAQEKVSDDLTRQGRYTEALDYAMKSLVVAEKHNLKRETVYGLANIGTVYIAMGKNGEALDYFSRAVKLAPTLSIAPWQMAPFYNNRGNALKKLGRYQLALEDYHRTLEVSKAGNFAMGITSGIANLGEVNMLMGNYKEALGYQLETVRLQEKDGDLTNLTENYQHVSTIYEKLGDYQLALEYQKKARHMRDSVASQKSDTTMSKLLTQYQNEKKEATIAAQEARIAQQKMVQWMSIGLAVLLAGLLIVGYRSLRSRSRSNKLLAKKNAENELLLKEIHHRVKNNLEVVSSLLALQSAQIDDPNTKDAMLEGQSRVHSIGIVHQKLYQGENLGSIEMKDYFVNLSESILDSFGAAGRVKIECAMEKLDVDIDTAVPLGLIVNELLTNTLKYAFPNQQHGSVRIKLEKQDGGGLHLEVSDNGIGKSGGIQGTGFGGQLISLLTRQLNGSMKEVVSNGTSVTFDFKIDKVA